MMYEGGNARLKAFFQSYQIPLNDNSIEYKYKTKASYFYRAFVRHTFISEAQLKYKLQGKLLPGPGFNEGKEVVEDGVAYSK